MRGRLERGLLFARENERVTMIMLSTALVMAGQGAISPVLPLFAIEFGAGATEVALALSIFGGARLLLNLPLGALSDRRGRRILLVSGPLVGALGMIGSGLAAGIADLLAWRFVAGAGSAMYMTGAQIYLIDVSSPANRARVIGANQGALLFGVSIGPGIGGLLGEAFGLRVPFFAVGGAAALAGLYAWWRLPETRPADEPAAGGDGAAAGGGDRLAAWRAFASLDFFAVCAVTATIFPTRAGGRLTLMPLLASEELRWSAGELGALFTVMAFVNLVGLAPASWVADRFGRKWAIVPSGLVIAAAFAWMTAGDGTAAFVASALLLAVGTSIIGPAPAAYAADIAPLALRGRAMGLYRSAGDTGFLLGPILLGAVADATSLHAGLATNAALVLATTALFALAARERR